MQWSSQNQTCAGFNQPLSGIGSGAVRERNFCTGCANPDTSPAQNQHSFLYAREAAERCPGCARAASIARCRVLRGRTTPQRLRPRKRSVSCQNPKQSCPGRSNKTKKVTPEAPRCQSARCCKYLLQLDKQRRCLHSNTHLEDKWICIVQNGDRLCRRGRLRLWCRWGLGRVPQVKKGKDGEWQDDLALLHVCNALFLFPSFLFFTLFFPLHPPAPFTAPSFSRHHGQPCPTSPFAVRSLPPNSAGAQTRPSAASGAPPDSVFGD